MSADDNSLGENDASRRLFGTFAKSGVLGKLSSGDKTNVALSQSKLDELTANMTDLMQEENSFKLYDEMLEYPGYSRAVTISVLYQKSGGDEAFIRGVLLMVASGFLSGTTHWKVLDRLTTAKREVVDACFKLFGVKSKKTQAGKAADNISPRDITLGRVLAAFPDVAFEFHCRKRDQYGWVEEGAVDELCSPAFRWPGGAALLKRESNTSKEFLGYVNWAYLFDKKTSGLNVAHTKDTEAERKAKVLKYAKLVKESSHLTELANTYVQRWEDFEGMGKTSL